MSIYITKGQLCIQWGFQCFDALVFFLFSGKKTENPLLLLGQYSDEEVEEEEEEDKEKAGDAAVDTSLANKNEQVTIINFYIYIGFTDVISVSPD